MRQRSFAVADQPNKQAMWKFWATRIEALNSQETPQATRQTMTHLIQKYRDKHIAEYAKSTRDADGSMLSVHFLPRWGAVPIENVRAEAVEDWIKGLQLSSAFKAALTRPLGADQVQTLRESRWSAVGVTLPDEQLLPEVIASLIRMSGGNFRLLARPLNQIERVLDLNDLHLVSCAAVEAALDSLVIGLG